MSRRAPSVTVAGSPADLDAGGLPILSDPPRQKLKPGLQPIDARHPPPQLPFEPPWNYVPSTPSTLKSVEESALEILNKLPAVEDQVLESGELGDLALAVQLAASNEYRARAAIRFP